MRPRSGHTISSLAYTRNLSIFISPRRNGLYKASLSVEVHYSSRCFHSLTCKSKPQCGTLIPSSKKTPSCGCNTTLMTNRPDKLPILRALDEEASHLEFSPTDKFSTILKASALTSFGEAMEEEFNAEQGNTSQYVHSEATDILQCALLTMTPEEKAHLLQQGTTLPKMPTISGIPPAFFSASVTSITTTLFPVMTTLHQSPPPSADNKRLWHGIPFACWITSRKQHRTIANTFLQQLHTWSRFHSVLARFQYHGQMITQRRIHTKFHNSAHVSEQTPKIYSSHARTPSPSAAEHHFKIWAKSYLSQRTSKMSHRIFLVVKNIRSVKTSTCTSRASSRMPN